MRHITKACFILSNGHEGNIFLIHLLVHRTIRLQLLQLYYIILYYYYYIIFNYYLLFNLLLPVAVTGSPNLLCCILRYFSDFAFCCYVI